MASRSMRGFTISLLHATYFRPGGPLPVRDSWLAQATDKDRIEYIVALDDSDLEAVARTEGCRRVVSPSSATVTAVRNWNAAAAEATGQLLVVIADDLVPGNGWDADLWRICSDADPAVHPFAIKVTDAPEQPRDTLLRHPVVSRAFYDCFGLFDDRYRGVYCDDDITLRAFWRAAIIDGRSIAFRHVHPSRDADVARSTSQTRINDHNEYTYGRQVFTGSWSRVHRAVPPRLVTPHVMANSHSFRTATMKVRLRTVVEYPLHWLWRRLRRLDARLGTPTSP